MGNTGQQSDFLKQFSDPKALLDFYFANYNLYDNIRPQNQLENIHAQNQNQKQFVNINEQNQNQNRFANIHYQNQNQSSNIFEHSTNQAGTQVKGNYGGHALIPLSNEQQMNAGTDYWFVNSKAPKR